MSRHTQIEIVDDLDGSPAEKTITFTVDGARYEIDLSEANAAAFTDALSPYLKAARKTGRRTSSRSRVSSTNAAGAPAKMVRDWAKAQGIAVNERGRIFQSVMDQYAAAH
ncbi:Lsr2 family protein [Tersicoccus sp. MR15.9]|uniref:histone-like nucleoid-structuring protein Lsr2 n=1 Tax=Tersicoccus mangrovi TaxID=3121635 RepID=UPI002FE55456